MTKQNDNTSERATKSQPGLSPEAQLILYCVSAKGEPEPYAYLQSLLAQNLNWEWITTIALCNEIFPLLFQSLQKNANGCVPQWYFEQLRHLSHQSMFHNLRLQDELVQLLRLFAEYDIPAVTFKGPTLAASLYPDIGYRAFRDLDILVPKQEVLRVKELLIRRGYVPRRRLSPANEATFLEANSECHFDHTDRQLNVDLHWEILPRRLNSQLNADYVWKRAIPQNIFGLTSYGLPPEELFLMLCQHGGASHGWKRLKWLFDLAMMIKRFDLDWARLLGEAVSLNLDQPLREGLYMAASLLGAPLPRPLVEELYSDSNLIARAAIVRGRIFNIRQEPPGFREWRSYVQADLATYHRASLSLRGIGQFLLYMNTITRPEAPDHRTAPHGRLTRMVGRRLTSKIHRFWRPVRLFRRHGLRLLRRLL